jgi:hypothetical protein
MLSIDTNLSDSAFMQLYNNRAVLFINYGYSLGELADWYLDEVLDC